MNYRWREYLTTGALMVGLMAGVFCLSTAIYKPRCAAIGGKWNVLRGCRVVNRNGDSQWVTRP